MNPGAAALYVPADNERAIEKAGSLEATAFIFDLEDAVAPAAKATARETLRRLWPSQLDRPRAIRLNGVSSEHFTEDLLLARKLMPDAIVLPKVESTRDLAAVEVALTETDAPPDLRVWAMIETPAGVLNVASIAAHGGRLRGVIVGTNDLAADTGISVADDRRNVHPWLLQVVLAARAYGLFVLDGVTNTFDDEALVEREAVESASLGFDGKTLIHPVQIAPTLRAFRPSEDRIAEARATMAAFANVDDSVGVISVNGRMVERLHLAAARRDLAKNGEHE